MKQENNDFCATNKTVNLLCENAEQKKRERERDESNG